MVGLIHLQVIIHPCSVVAINVLCSARKGASPNRISDKIIDVLTCDTTLLNRPVFLIYTSIHEFAHLLSCQPSHPADYKPLSIPSSVSLLLPVCVCVCVCMCVCVRVTGGLRLSIASALNSISGAISSGVPFSIIVTRDAVCHAPPSTSTSTSTSTSNSTSTSDPSVIRTMGVSWSEVSLEDTTNDQSPSSSSSSASSIVHETILSLIRLWKSQDGLCQSVTSTDLLHNLRAAYFLDMSGAADMQTVCNPNYGDEVQHKGTTRGNILNLRVISSLDDDIIIRGRNKNKQSLNISVAADSMPPSQELRSKISLAKHSRFKIQVLDQCMRCLSCALSGLASSVAPFPMLEQVEPVKWLQSDISRALDAQIAHPIFSASSRDAGYFSENTTVAGRHRDSNNALTAPSTSAIAAKMLVNLVCIVNQSTQHCIGR